MGDPDEKSTPLVPTEISAGQAEAGLRCSVCLESFRESEAASGLVCGHVYHTACISAWLSDHDSCPFCRRVVAVKEDDDPEEYLFPDEFPDEPHDEDDLDPLDLDLSGLVETGSPQDSSSEEEFSLAALAQNWPIDVLSSLSSDSDTDTSSSDSSDSS